MFITNGRRILWRLASASLAGDTARAANTDEVRELRREAHDLITSPAFVVIKAANEFKDKTTRLNEMWQTDFTYFKIIGWDWMYLSTILDDYSRYIIARKQCTTMKAEDVTDTLKLALKASGCDEVNVLHKPRLLSDDGPSYVAGELADWLGDRSVRHVRGAPFHPQT